MRKTNRIFEQGNTIPQNFKKAAHKQTYSCLCEPAGKYLSELKQYETKANIALKNMERAFDNYANGDHSDIGEHFHVFESVGLGEGFMLHAGMDWPQTVPRVIINIITMECEMDDEHGYLSLAPVYNEGIQHMELAFFTESFRESWGDTTKYGMDMLYLLWAQCDCSVISTISPSCEARWIFPEGMAIGRKQCGFYVFDEFTDAYKHPMKPLTDSDWDDIWNNY